LNVLKLFVGSQVGEEGRHLKDMKAKIAEKATPSAIIFLQGIVFILGVVLITLTCKILETNNSHYLNSCSICSKTRL